jgi:hypothetical protein
LIVLISGADIHVRERVVHLSPNATGISDEKVFTRLERRRDLPRYGIRIDIIESPVGVASERSDDGHVPVVEEDIQQCGIDLLDVANPSEIDQLPVDLPGRTLYDLEDRPIRPRNPDRAYAGPTSMADQGAVELASHSPQYDAKIRVCRNAAAMNHPRLVSQPARDVRRQWSTAMYDHDTTRAHHVRYRRPECIQSIRSNDERSADLDYGKFVHDLKSTSSIAVGLNMMMNGCRSAR